MEMLEREENIQNGRKKIAQTKEEAFLNALRERKEKQMKEEKSKRRNRKEQGITLVALIITIIILIILAAVTINSIVQMNMIEKAIGAAERYETEQQREGDMMSSVDSMIAGIGSGSGGSIEVGKEAGSQGTINGEKGTYTNPTIPKGYYPINTDNAKWDKETGPEYNKGLVITDEVDSEGNSTGNEWVWVPVSNPTDMYEETIEAIAITGGTGNNYISNVSTKRYSKLEILSGQTRGLPNSTSRREPDVVVEDGTQYDAVQENRTKAGFTTLENMARTLVTEYSTMIDSVTKYGGFYLGRYELTEAGEKPGVPLTDTDWYDLYAKCKTLSKSGSNTIARMLWGCQWDMTCKWLADAGYDIDDSKDWGNYRNSTVTANDGTTVLKPADSSELLDTGITTYTMANNLYDIAGNVCDWTQEASYVRFRARRGGYYYHDGDVAPASSIDEDVPEYTPGIFRYTSHFNLEPLTSNCDS